MRGRFGPERPLARVCREAGATVRIQPFDARVIEVLASGLTLHPGAQLAVDITLIGALGARGGTRSNAFHTNGVILTAARLEKERNYQELLVSERCRLVVVAMETGGRRSKEATDFINSLAEAKAREALPLLRSSALYGWRRRWTRLLAVSRGRAFASSLVSSRSAGLNGQDGPSPGLAELFASG